ncbi:UDP-N-acetylmuramoylalanine--D-glutamate ligase, partial [Vibrio parahaemolyticus VPTS-2010]
PRG